MNREFCSAALTAETHEKLVDHLVRSDRQEDLCFALYRPSHGERRFSGLINEIILPLEGDRQVHGNASFNPQYFERVLERALEAKAGIVFLHSHPRGECWQGMSDDDRKAESDMAGAVFGATELPLIGLTLSGKTGFWSGRSWWRTAPRTWEPQFCESVRIVGRRLRAFHCPHIRDHAEISDALDRTVHAWGDDFHSELTRLRVGVVGLGSVGSLVSECLARMGMSEVVYIDFDKIKEVNLDRTTNAYPEHVQTDEPKARLASRAAHRAATNRGFNSATLLRGIQEVEAYRAALDCDVLFSCVDRPWARSILNFVAYAHLIPVIDGGIDCSRLSDGSLRSVDWGAFVVGPGRRCLECHGQYDPGLVAVERDGMLDDPGYIENLPADSPLRKRENVFVFSMALASLEVLKLTHLVGGFGGIEVPGSERYTFPAGHGELEYSDCEPSCAHPSLLALGEDAGHPGTE